MGNRAVVTTKEKKTGVYLHWDGGLGSVTGICTAARELGYRDPGNDPLYALARFAFLAGVLACEDGLSLGAGPLDELDCDNGNNGVYVIGKGWMVTGRYGDGSTRKFKPAKGSQDEGRARKVADELIARVKNLREFAGRKTESSEGVAQ